MNNKGIKVEDITIIVCLFLFLSIVLASICLNSSVNLAEDLQTKQVQDKLNDTSKLDVNISFLGQPINNTYKNFLSSFYTSFFNSLSGREEALDKYFYQSDPDSVVAATFDNTYLVTLNYIRDLSPIDLDFNQTDIRLDIIKVDVITPTDVLITLDESQKVYFNAMKDSKPDYAETTGIRNYFRIITTPEGLKLIRHDREEDLMILMHTYLQERAETSSEQLSSIVQIGKELRKRAEGYNAYYSLQRESIEPVLTNSAYNRDKAVNYAKQFALTDNPAFVNFEDYGGNCNNFVSQVLIAGGIPQDEIGPDYWYYDGEFSSPSWLTVNDFYDYATYNTEGGVKMSVSENLYSGEKGDIIQVGDNNNYEHALIITEPVKDNKGNTIDYLVASNSLDRANYPLSAYGYAQFRLIKIV